MSKDTGGSAFPCPIAMNEIGNLTTSDEYGRGGMTLRDYFAAKAMQGLYANADTTMIPDNHSETESTVEICASLAYQIADAMLAERGKP